MAHLLDQLLLDSEMVGIQWIAALLVIGLSIREQEQSFITCLVDERRTTLLQGVERS